MIKIIRQGTRKTIECNECGCQFSYENEDIEEEEESLSPISFTYRRYIICPQCKNILYLEASK